MKVYLVRHAEAHSNVRGGGAQPINDVLTLDGISQLTGLSRFFVDNDIKMIYTSPILRAKETARNMTLQGVSIEEWDDLRERKGVFEVAHRFHELPEDRMIEAVRAARDGYPEWLPEHDEPFEKLRERVFRVKKRLEESPLSAVSVVSHMGFLGVLLAFMKYGNTATEDVVVDFMYSVNMPNASVSATEYIPEQNCWEILSVGDVSYAP